MILIGLLLVVHQGKKMVLFAPSSYVGLLLTNTLLLAFGASISSYGQTNPCPSVLILNTIIQAGY